MYRGITEFVNLLVYTITKDTIVGDNTEEWCGEERRSGESVCVYSERLDRLETMHDDIKVMREIIEAWNNAKGFVILMKAVGTAVKWIAQIGIIIGALWMFIKTGHIDIKGLFE